MLNIALDNNCTWISITSVGASTYDGVPIFDTYTFSYVDSKGDNVYVTKPKEEWFLHKDNQSYWIVSQLNFKLKIFIYDTWVCVMHCA